MTRPRTVNIALVLYFATVIVGLLWLLFDPPKRDGAVVVAQLFGSLTVSALFLVFGYFPATGRKWARWVNVVLALQPVFIFFFNESPEMTLIQLVVFRVNAFAALVSAVLFYTPPANQWYAQVALTRHSSGRASPAA